MLMLSMQRPADCLVHLGIPQPQQGCLGLPAKAGTPPVTDFPVHLFVATWHCRRQLIPYNGIVLVVWALDTQLWIVLLE